MNWHRLTGYLVGASALLAAMYLYFGAYESRRERIEEGIHSPDSVWYQGGAAVRCLAGVEYLVIKGPLKLALTENRDADGGVVLCDAEPSKKGDGRLYRVCKDGILYYTLRDFRVIGVAVAYGTDHRPIHCSGENTSPPPQ